ncbi:hypothetical protein G9A89_014473 [Geosiphon pyriformis]|nr:hypothetical protein G9A89_014473 [Geosiphon pyriformis]
MSKLKELIGKPKTSSTGLGTHPNTKKKHVKSVYSYVASYKKLKKPEAGSVLVNLSIGSLALENIGRSEVGSVASSVSGLSDVENMANTIAKEMSYVESSEDDDINNATLKKTPTQMYILGNSLKALTFDTMNNDESVLGLFSPKFVSFNQLPLARSYVIKKCSFKPVKLFALNVELSAEVIVKEIPVDLFRLAIESVFSKFALVEFESSTVASLVASKWLVLVMARDHYRTLLYTLPVGTTAHDLLDLVTFYGEKTCFIGYNFSSYAHNRCAVVCFNNEASKLAVIGFVLVYRGVNLYWAGLSLVCCAKCKQFVVTDQDRVCLAGIYKRKQALIAHLISFGVYPSILFGAGLSLVAETFLFTSTLPGDHSMYDCLASLERSMELLADQVSGILEKLNSMKLVPMATTSNASLTVVLVSAVLGLNSNMVLDSVSMISNLTPLVISNTAPVISPSSFKVLTTKIGGLESKMVALEVLVESVLEKLDHLCSGLGLLAASISQ